MQCEKDNEPSPKAEGRETYQKENVAHVGAGAEEEEEAKLSSWDTYRGKQLPPGMKLKKRVEERNSPKGNGVENMSDKVKDKSIENHTEPGEAEKMISTSNVKAVHSEKINQTSQDPHKDSPQQPTDGKTCLEQSDPTVKETVSKSSPSGSTQATRDSDNTRHHTSHKPTQSSQTKKHQDDDDDDVVLASVKPAAQKTPPVSAVQKTLTSFPGFQPVSKVKCQQEDPKGLRSLLTTQLQQKKVSVKDTIGCLVKF